MFGGFGSVFDMGTEAIHVSLECGAGKDI